MEEVIKILAVDNLTHNVKRFTCEKPKGFQFIPGQATEVSINKEGWREKKRPFTFTSLNELSNLEFVIKIYKDHPGVTNELDSLKPGDELIVRDPWGAIEYQGPGYFIAGGAGITPFIAIFRQLKKQGSLLNNKLFFSNKSVRDIILKDELSEMLNGNAIFILTDEPDNNFYNGLINEDFLKQHIDNFNSHFYLCGPPGMIQSMQKTLTKLGAKAEAVVFEK